MRFAPRTGALLIALGACAACPAAAPAAESWLQPETLSQPGTSNDRARIATNSPGSSSRGGKKSGSGSSSRQGGTTAQKKAAGRKGGRASSKS